MLHPERSRAQRINAGRMGTRTDILSGDYLTPGKPQVSLTSIFAVRAAVMRAVEIPVRQRVLGGEFVEKTGYSLPVLVRQVSI
jgi:hypothetical protein